MYVCTRVDIGPFMESEGIAGEDPEQQQLGEGCPMQVYNSLPAFTPLYLRID
jgi:hypothetical protein